MRRRTLPSIPHSWHFLANLELFYRILELSLVNLSKPLRQMFLSGDSNTFVRLYKLRFKNPFSSIPTFSFLCSEHLKQRDKWRPRGRLHSDGQVSYWTGNTKHFSSQNTVSSMFREMRN